MNQQLVPMLKSSEFSSIDTPFRRDQLRYEFRRRQSGGTHVVAVLFNRKREALFSVQLYIEPPQGVPAFLAAGGTLRVATLSAARTWWPRGVTPFRAAPTLLDRLRGHRVIDVERPIQHFAVLLPHAEQWFSDRTRSRFVVDGRVALRPPV